MEETYGDTTCEQVEKHLARTLADLGVNEFVIVGEPQPPAPPRTGLLRRRPAPPPSRYVQFRRDDETAWYGECVGATRFGGDWEVPEEVHDRLRSLGWLAPGDPDPTGTQPSYPHYWQCVTTDPDRPSGHEPGTDPATELARLGAAALDLLGVDPWSLTWRRELNY
ncbi:TY-Chap domain-containing protein [Nocardioides panaciterrulae]|uniref:TY-Chap N-terminal domain-containing protein n=1 Tax=Nocardioides panaciterrulae TaxID=661492 RepID=A0A7Y9E3I2_9ACTN|nr:hypothetical protein [Nocardioides panaciterrulae]NYD40534.1 hypothetical protein [Nocardioides panaciterrulae]